MTVAWLCAGAPPRMSMAPIRIAAKKGDVFRTLRDRQRSKLPPALNGTRCLVFSKERAAPFDQQRRRFPIKNVGRLITILWHPATGRTHQGLLGDPLPLEPLV